MISIVLSLSSPLSVGWLKGLRKPGPMQLDQIAAPGMLSHGPVVLEAAACLPSNAVFLYLAFKICYGGVLSGPFIE